MNEISLAQTAIVAHDAGAANHIVAWLQSGCLDINTVSICFDGPAKKIINTAFPSFSNKSLSVALTGVTVLISGTGWASDLEYKSRKIASHRGVKNIAVIDHWTNYEARFIRNNELLLPDEIWVVDKYAEKIALTHFPDIPVFIKPNDFISLQCNEIKKISEKSESYLKFDILFVMEPISEVWERDGILGEIQAFKFLLENLHFLDLDFSKEINITIRPHPSDNKGKYNGLLKYENEIIKIKIDEAHSLAELIALSSFVVGCQTYAMIVALEADKKVYSALPCDAPSCLLPHENIIHLRDYL